MQADVRVVFLNLIEMIQEAVELRVIVFFELEEKRDHSQSVGLLRTLLHRFVLLVAMNQMHFHRVMDVVEGVLGAALVVVAPVEVERNELIFAR